MKMFKKPNLAIATFVLLFFVLIYLFVSGRFTFGSPPVLTTNFVDLDQISEISRYRSCQGHVVVPQDRSEERRNMKHYFRVKKDFFGQDTVPLYAPYDGFASIIRKDPEHGLQGEIWITQSMLPPFAAWSFSIEHINIKEGLKIGDKVKAGDLIGYAALSGEQDKASFDVIYARVGIPPRKIDGWTSPFSALDTVFNHMSDKVFSEYQQKGVSSREMMQYTKEERDKDLCEYRKDYREGMYFMGGNESDWVKLK